MGAFKAPGPDGLQPHFFQSQWDVVGEKVCDLVSYAFRDPSTISSFNKTNIVLIPKVDNPLSIKDFRPISLCNVSYKILSKVIANRLKKIMGSLIHQTQCSFVIGRQSCDNIILAQEAIHSMRSKRTGRGYVAIKVDMEKAFDRLDWGFLKFNLQSLGFNHRLISLIMACVSSASLNVCWNGSPSEDFSPSRGVRQGDPLSPYLFVICMERLGQLIRREVDLGNWKPLRMSSQGPHLSHLFFADDLLLFCEASSDQLDRVRNIMLRFCHVSGHKISLNKSRIFVSKNVHSSRANEFSNQLGILLTSDLGKYLGVPLLHKRVVKVTFAPLISKVQNKLASWKGRFLSMAGRTVMIKSVLSSIPSYQMQSMLIPRGVLKEIDKLCRNFFWNHGDQGTKIHLLSWDLIKQDKEKGGLGIKDLVRQNMAFIMKLCWGLMTRRDDLWVKCLRNKYGCGDGKFPIVAKRHLQSPIWGSIIKVWESFRAMVGSRVRNGHGTMAWWELWTPLDRPLSHFVNKNHHLIDHDATVADFVTPQGLWDVGKWGMFLPDWVVDTICELRPPSGHSQDSIEWRASSDGIFSVKSAYNLLEDREHLPPVGSWKELWRWPIPERVKFFMWQVFHERLPTNSLRAIRGLCEHNECPFQCQREESILHMLRDCEIANSVWLLIINPIYYSTFFNGNLQEWLSWNSQQEAGSLQASKGPWLKTFAIICWLIWKNRCHQVFEGNSAHPQNIINHCKYLLFEDAECSRWRHKIFCVPQRSADKWLQPPDGYVRVDVDASVKDNNQAACGGLIRNHHACWVVGFQQKLQPCAPTMAELLAIKAGLGLCKSLGFKKVKLYSDSAVAIQTLMSDGGVYHPWKQEIEDIKSMIFSSWDIQIIHSHREVLRCADFLARKAHHANTELSVILEPPVTCWNLMLADFADIG